MKMISLYSGVGGLDLAAHWAGIETVAFCEKDEWRRSVLRRHWPNVPQWEDDESLTIESLRERGVTGADIVAGGPPCQPFSISGAKRGKADPRHRWPQMARIVSEVRPSWVVFENVPHIANLALDAVLDDLDHLGYSCRTFVVPAGAVGSPQVRARVFSVAYAGRAELQQVGDSRFVFCAEGEGEGEEIQRKRGCADARDRGAAEGMAYAVEDGRGERGASHNDDGSDALGDDSGRRRLTVGNAAALRREGLRADRLELAAEDAREGLPLGSSEDATRNRRSTQSRLGRVAHGISARLDAAGWPFPMLVTPEGERIAGPQFDYEAPRTTTEKNLRRKRVAALGDAVCPYQAFPIFAVIVAVDGGLF